jgi:hypothetical protein
MKDCDRLIVKTRKTSPNRVTSFESGKQTAPNSDPYLRNEALDPNDGAQLEEQDLTATTSSAIDRKVEDVAIYVVRKMYPP